MCVCVGITVNISVCVYMCDRDKKDTERRFCSSVKCVINLHTCKISMPKYIIRYTPYNK